MELVGLDRKILMYFNVNFRIILLLNLILFNAFQNSSSAENASGKQFQTDTIKLQLKWQHQFQFAGYYAAIEKGFYKNEGLEVKLLEGNARVNPTDEILNDKANFAVSSPRVILERATNKPFVVLAAIFQHSPSIILVNQDSVQPNIHGLFHKRVMFESKNDPEILAMLYNEGMNLSDVQVLDHTGNVELLLKGQIDAQTAYITNEPFNLKKAGLKPGIISPINYGIDFYGDCLITTQWEIDKNPARVSAFLRATKKGWLYAMEHHFEISQLIISKYHSKKSLSHLLYEASQMQLLIKPRDIEIGHLNEYRWQQIAETYKKLGLLKPNFSLDGFLYSEGIDYRMAKYIKYTSIAAIICFLLITLLLLYYYQLNRSIKKKTDQIRENEEQFRYITENLVDLICQTDLNGIIQYISPSFIKNLGYKTENIISSSIFDLVYPDDRNFITQAFKKGIEKLASEKAEFRFLLADGSFIWIETIGNIIFNKEGKPTSVVLGSRDITGRKHSEEHIYKQAQLHANLLSAIPAIVYLKDIEFKYIEVNDKMCQLLGLEKDQIIGKTDYDLFPEDMADLYFFTDVEIFHTGKAKHNIEAEYKLPNDENFWLSTSKMPHHNSLGEIIGLAGISIDITERQLEEEVLHITQFAIDNASQSVIWMNPSGTIVYMNVASIKLNKPRDLNLLGRKIWEFDSNFTEISWKSYWEQLKTEKVIVLNSTLTNKIGETFHIETHANYVEFKGKEYCISYGLDITDRKNAEDKLKTSENQYRTIIENIYDVVWIMDLDLKTLFVTPSIERLTGYPVEEHMKLSLEKRFTPDSLIVINKWFANLYPKFKNNEIDSKTFILKGELEYRCKNGGSLWTEVTIKLLIDKENNFIGIHGTSVNIDQRKRTEVELIASKARFKSIYDNIKDIYYEVLMDSTVVEISPSVEKLTKYKREEILGTSLYDYYSDINQRTKLINEILAKGSVSDFEITFIDKDKTQIACAITSSIVRNEANIPYKICGTIRDIRERKQVQKTLEESEERYKSLVSLSPNPVMVLSQGKYIYLNPSAVNFFECKDANELIGKEFINSVYLDDKPTILSLLENISDDKPNPPIEIRIQKSSGSIVNILSTSISITFAGNPAVLIVSQDFTSQKQYEEDLQKSKLKAEESDKLKSAFLANMSHEIRTPLNGIIGFAGLLKRPGLTKEKQAGYAQIINSSSHQLLAIINDIIDISKIEAGQMTLNNEPLNLNTILDDTYSIYSALADKKSIDMVLIKGLSNESAEIITDEVKLKQILNNLLNNALKFTHEGYIEMGCTLKNDYLEFYVKDSGIGISEESKRIVFERFRQAEYADNRKYGGTGLGLSISKALVEMMGGKIWLESEPKLGTAFYFTHPYNQVELTNTDETLSKYNVENFSWENKTILIAEDEKMNMFFLQELIENTGAKILIAENGRQAVDLYNNHPEIDVVLLDIKMPEMDGFQVVKIIKSINKNSIVIAQTAYAMSNDKLEAIESGFDDYISKPIERDVLLKTINKYFIQ